MSLTIGSLCTGCGACIDECPNEAIKENKMSFYIDPSLCTECKDLKKGPQCEDVCPIEGCCSKVKETDMMSSRTE